jgi:hypothetical protein
VVRPVVGVDDDDDAPGLDELRVHYTAAIAPTNLCELHAAGESSAPACAVFLAAIAGATDSELEPALAAPMELDGLDAAPPAPASFTHRRTSHRYRQRLRSFADRVRNLGHHVDDHLQVDADVQRDERSSRRPSRAAADLNGKMFEAAIILPTPWWRSLTDAVAVQANGGRLTASGLSTASPHGIHRSPPAVTVSAVWYSIVETQRC